MTLATLVVQQSRRGYLLSKLQPCMILSEAGAAAVVTGLLLASSGSRKSRRGCSSTARSTHKIQGVVGARDK